MLLYISVFLPIVRIAIFILAHPSAVVITQKCNIYGQNINPGGFIALEKQITFTACQCSNRNLNTAISLFRLFSLPGSTQNRIFRHCFRICFCLISFIILLHISLHYYSNHAHSYRQTNFPANLY